MRRTRTAVVSAIAGLAFLLGCGFGATRRRRTFESHGVPAPAATASAALLKHDDGSVLTAEVTVVHLRPSLRLWAVVTLSIAAVCLTVAAVLLWMTFAGRAPTPSEGGVMILLDGSAQDRDVGISAEIWHTGDDRVDMLRVEVTADPRLPPGTRWYMFASGQYAVSRSAPLEFFCSSGAFGDPTADGVRCPKDGGDGATDAVEYRFGEALGLASAGEVTGIEDHVGYDESTVSAITGVYRPAYASDQTWTVDIPISRIQLGKSGYEHDAVLAPIAYRAASFGASIETFPVSPIEHDASYVSTVDGRTLEPVRVTSFRMDATSLAGGQRLVWAQPNTITDDTVIWQTDGGTYAQMAFTVVESNGPARSAFWAFVGGTLVSTALAALFLLLERWLQRRQDFPDG